MRTLPKYLHIAFWTFAAVNIIANFFTIRILELISKPLLMIVLLAYFTLIMRTMRGRTYLFAFFALFFSWCGDLFLLFQSISESYFVIGLVAFLLAHICYTFEFNRLRTKPEPEHRDGAFVNIRIVFLTLVGSAVYFLFYPGLGNLKFPVAIYTFTLILMAIFAVKRKGLTTDQSFMLVYSGALLFITSDSMIGIDKFIRPINYLGVLVMTTYIAAQYMIVRGVLIHVKKYKQADPSGEGHVG